MRLDADYFVYEYNYDGNDGEGFAIWKIGGNYCYTELDHDSCQGPVGDLNSISYSFKEMEKIADKYGFSARNVLDYIEDNL